MPSGTTTSSITATLSQPLPSTSTAGSNTRTNTDDARTRAPLPTQPTTPRPASTNTAPSNPITSQPTSNTQRNPVREHSWGAPTAYTLSWIYVPLIHAVLQMEGPNARYTALEVAEAMEYNTTAWIQHYRQDFHIRNITLATLRQRQGILHPTGYIDANEQTRLLHPRILYEMGLEEEPLGESTVQVEIHAAIGEFYARVRNNPSLQDIPRINTQVPPTQTDTANQITDTSSSTPSITNTNAVSLPAPGPSCTICLEPDYVPVRANPCQCCSFCEPCVTQWVENTGRCPLCRRRVFNTGPVQQSRNEDTSSSTITNMPGTSNTPQENENIRRTTNARNTRTSRTIPTDTESRRHPSISSSTTGASNQHLRTDTPRARQSNRIAERQLQQHHAYERHRNYYASTRRSGNSYPTAPVSNQNVFPMNSPAIERTSTNTLPSSLPRSQYSWGSPRAITLSWIYVPIIHAALQMDGPNANYPALEIAQEMGYNTQAWINAYRNDFRDRGIALESLTARGVILANGYISADEQMRLLHPVNAYGEESDSEDSTRGEANINAAIHAAIGEFYIQVRNNYALQNNYGGHAGDSRNNFVNIPTDSVPTRGTTMTATDSASPMQAPPTPSTAPTTTFTNDTNIGARRSPPRAPNTTPTIPPPPPSQPPRPTTSQCIICLEDSYVPAHAIPCHCCSFCYNCIEEWVDAHGNCPLCRMHVNEIREEGQVRASRSPTPSDAEGQQEIQEAIAAMPTTTRRVTQMLVPLATPTPPLVLQPLNRRRRATSTPRNVRRQRQINRRRQFAPNALYVPPRVQSDEEEELSRHFIQDLHEHDPLF